MTNKGWQPNQPTNQPTRQPGRQAVSHSDSPTVRQSGNSGRICFTARTTKGNKNIINYHIKYTVSIILPSISVLASTQARACHYLGHQIFPPPARLPFMAHLPAVRPRPWRIYCSPISSYALLWLKFFA